MLIGNYEYSRRNRDNLPLPIQIELYKKSYTFYANFEMTFWLLREIFNVLKKKNEPHRSSISEVIDSKRCA